MNLYLQLSLAPSTRSSYNSAKRAFVNFAQHYRQLHPNGSPLPASEATLMLFATYLTHTLKPQSIKFYLSAVRSWHIEHSLPDPTAEAPNLRRFMRGIKRYHGSPPDRRLPITPVLLRTFRNFLNLSYSDHLTLWAAVLVAFFGFLRSNERLSLRHCDLHRTPAGYQIWIGQSKTDPFRSGATVRLSRSGDPNLCAVMALDTFLASRMTPNGPLFRSQTGMALTHHRLNYLIQDLAARSGVESGRYSSHSFRIGAASAAAAAGVPDWKIQALGRWSSDCYKRYVRLPTSETDTVAGTIARMPL